MSGFTPDPPPPSHLDAISTRWSVLHQAHHEPAPIAGRARAALAERYGPAIFAYVRAIVRDEHDAEDLAQEIIVRILCGKFSGADPGRGRFRDFLKVAVRNLVRTHWGRKARRSGKDLDVDTIEPPSGNEPDLDEELDREWVLGWRQNLLDLAWHALDEHQARQPGSMAYTVLRLRAEHPDASGEDLARLVSNEIKREVKPDAMRQQLRRARIRFARFLIDEVSRSLEDPKPESIQDELVQLGLYEYVKDFIEGNDDSE
ncbi:MAG TPA: RNA polymerase sigma factor [Planctomycetota bacterium]|nr:RNA polymerase sigma factor [Planctomycetota bacterium]